MKKDKKTRGLEKASVEYMLKRVSNEIKLSKVYKIMKGACN